MGENISHSLNLLELRVKLPHLQILVIVELQSILFTIGYFMEGTLKIVCILKRKKKISSVQFENLKKFLINLSYDISYRIFSGL